MLIQECLTTFSAVRKHKLIPYTNKVCTQNIHLLRQDQIRVQEDLLHCKFFFIHVEMIYLDQRGS